MKKNGEYVGVDEKFIPEDEKYVDESILGNKEKTYKTVKKIGIGYLCFIIIIFAFAIGMIIFIASMFFGTFNKINDKFDQMNSQMSNEEEKWNESFNVSKFNQGIEFLQGTKNGNTIVHYLDNVVTSNKTNKEHTITVIYNDLTTTDENDIVKVKQLLDDWAKYECSLDYDEDGYIYMITIKNM